MESFREDAFIVSDLSNVGQVMSEVSGALEHALHIRR